MSMDECDDLHLLVPIFNFNCEIHCIIFFILWFVFTVHLYVHMENSVEAPHSLQVVEGESKLVSKRVKNLSQTSWIKGNERWWLNDETILVQEILKIIEIHDECCFVPSENKVDNLNSLFSMIIKIGCGATSSVFLAQNRRTLKFAALKHLSIDDKYNLPSFENEYKILTKLNHKNIAKLYSCYIDRYNYYISTEYYNGGNLADCILKFKFFSERQARRYVKTIINTVKYIHDNDIVHRDLKPGNLVFDKQIKLDRSDKNINDAYDYDDHDARLKLIDFGLAIEIKDDETNSDFVGTLVYLPPESVKKKRTGKEFKAGDMWSIGIITYLLVYGKPPFYGPNRHSTMAKIITNDIEWSKTINISDECKDFIAGLLNKDAQRRWTAKEAINHTWFNMCIESTQKNHETGEKQSSEMYAKSWKEKMTNWLR